METENQNLGTSFIELAVNIDSLNGFVTEGSCSLGEAEVAISISEDGPPFVTIKIWGASRCTKEVDLDLLLQLLEDVDSRDPSALLIAEFDLIELLTIVASNLRRMQALSVEEEETFCRGEHRVKVSSKSIAYSTGNRDFVPLDVRDKVQIHHLTQILEEYG